MIAKSKNKLRLLAFGDLAIICYVPHPRIPATEIAPTIAQGTAVAAFAASSLIWTLESNEPVTNTISASSTRESGKNSQIVHSGAKKLKMNAYPAGHPLRFVKFPRAKLASFMNSFGVAAGRAMITARHNL